MVHARLFAILAFAGSASGCGSRTGALAAAGAGDAPMFLGAWTCDVSSDAVANGVVLARDSFTANATLVARSGGGISMSLARAGMDAGAPGGERAAGCGAPYDFTVSGSTATAFAGPTCAGGGATDVFQSAVFAVAGSTATLTVVASVVPDQASDVDRTIDTISGTCGRD